MTARPVVELSAPPDMRAAFARAMVPGGKGSARIPQTALALRDVAQDGARYAEYSRVCGFTLRDQVPPTWLHVLTFPLHLAVLSSPQSSVRLAGLVHVSNTMTIHRAVAADERLDITVHADGPRPHRRGALVDLVGRIDVDGETVWDGVSTYLASGMQAPGEIEEQPKPEFEPAGITGTWRLPATLGRRYRDVSGDPNPIHTSALAARVFGFRRPIIHGMWTHARMLAALESRLPDAYRTDVSFIRPVSLPSTVGYVLSAREDGFDTAVTDARGDKPRLLLSTFKKQ